MTLQEGDAQTVRVTTYGVRGGASRHVTFIVAEKA